jgi:hypothetical protein
MYNFKEKHITSCGVMVLDSWLEGQRPRFRTLGFTIFLVNFSRLVVSHMWGHALVRPMCAWDNYTGCM